MTKEKLTACKDCSFYLNTCSNVWFDQRCFCDQDDVQVLHDVDFDPVNGNYKYERKSYGPSDKNYDRLSYCKDLNPDGHCEHFEQKTELTACKNCLYYKIVYSGRIWYDHYCLFVKKTGSETFFNFITGRYEKIKDKHLPKCKGINKSGHCEHFSEKAGVWSRIFGKKTNNRKDVK